MVLVHCESEKRIGRAERAGARPSVSRYAMLSRERSVKSLCAGPGALQRKTKTAVRQNGRRVWSGQRGSGVRCANPDPSLASSVGRIPENVPPARFLNGIPPHRFEPRITESQYKTTWKLLPGCRIIVERTTGFEPATPTLARWCSTS